MTNLTNRRSDRASVSSCDASSTLSRFCARFLKETKCEDVLSFSWNLSHIFKVSFLSMISKRRLRRAVRRVRSLSWTIGCHDVASLFTLTFTVPLQSIPSAAATVESITHDYRLYIFLLILDALTHFGKP